MTRRAPGSLAMVSLAALIIAILFGGYVASLVMTARSVPPIHDVTTNMDSVPRFFRLNLREDNFEVVHHEGEPRLIRMTPADRWRERHSGGTRAGEARMGQ